jgi:hypothetical protein
MKNVYCKYSTVYVCMYVCMHICTYVVVYRMYICICKQQLLILSTGLDQLQEE